jgi:hypothetical protein
MTESPAVFRNARYEARLAFHEQRIAALEGINAQLCEGLNFAINALHALGATVQSRAETLPGEWKPELARRPH